MDTRPAGARSLESISYAFLWQIRFSVEARFPKRLIASEGPIGAACKGARATQMLCFSGFCAFWSVFWTIFGAPGSAKGAGFKAQSLSPTVSLRLAKEVEG